MQASPLLAMGIRSVGLIYGQSDKCPVCGLLSLVPEERPETLKLANCAHTLFAVREACCPNRHRWSWCAECLAVRSITR